MKNKNCCDVESLIESAGRCIEEKRLDDAILLLERVWQIEEKNIQALCMLGFVRFLKGDYTGCEEINRRVLSMDAHNSYAVSGLGIALAAQGKLDEGILLLEQAIGLDPRWEEPYWDLAVILGERRRYVEAIEVLKRGIVSIPSAKKRFSSLEKVFQEKMKLNTD